MPEIITAPIIRSMRTKGEKVVCITAYDAVFGELADAAGADIVLVGDSVGNTVLGYSSTIPVNLEDMVHHTRAVRRGVKRALLIADLPFGSYQSSTEQAVQAAVALVKAGAQAVKLEGSYTQAIAEIIRAGIPVMGHVGMTPQSINLYGGFRVQGKGDHAQGVLNAAKQVQNAGAFAIVLELIPAALSAQITDLLHIPTIGIGAGVNCSGQVQVIYDVLGLSQTPLKHAKSYVAGRESLVSAIKQYTSDVREGVFPGDENSF